MLSCEAASMGWVGTLVVLGGFVLCLCLTQHPDRYLTYADPAQAVFGPCDNTGTAVMFALHLYHVAAFRPLDPVDWFHHILMVFLICPAA